MKAHLLLVDDSEAQSKTDQKQTLERLGYR